MSSSASAMNSTILTINLDVPDIPEDTDLVFFHMKDRVSIIPVDDILCMEDSDVDRTGEPSCSFDGPNRFESRRKSVLGHPSDDSLIYTFLQRLPMKDFAAEVRASMDVDQFLNQAVLLLDVPDTSVEGIIDKMLRKVRSFISTSQILL
ncbi:uncharacterized protein CDAR_538771 [Caerostris darwini]|uniref:Uncharacterized protein n=1 Tax=Caerostris darwini TaxID=1538125 RepID=A0AAV4SZM0_9ARAC|nr:uncharacterized protein CDAR_538771 [Caerostris darwini]